MVKFLLTIILAIIIFAPACLLTSKFFRLSAQGKTSFQDLYKTIQDFAKKGKFNEPKGFTLILDENTYVAKFDKDKDMGGELSRVVYPQSQCNRKDCLVLCQEITTEPLLTATKPHPATASIQLPREFGTHTCKAVIAIPLKDDFLLNSFIAMRFDKDPATRRVFLNLHKEADGRVTITGLSPLVKMIDIVIGQLKISRLTEPLVTKQAENKFSLSWQGQDNLAVDVNYNLVNFGDEITGIDIDSQFFVNKKPALIAFNKRDAYPQRRFKNVPDLYRGIKNNEFILKEKNWFFLETTDATRQQINQPYYIKEIGSPEKIVVLTRESQTPRIQQQVQQQEWIFTSDGDLDSKKIVSSAWDLVKIEYVNGKRSRDFFINLNERKLDVKDYNSNKEEIFPESSKEYLNVINQFQREIDDGLVEELISEESKFKLLSVEEASEIYTNFKDVGRSLQGVKIEKVNSLPFDEAHSTLGPTTYVLLNKDICECKDPAKSCICEICVKVEALPGIEAAVVPNFKERAERNNQQCAEITIT